MPSFETSYRNQYAVMWAAGPPDVHNEPTLLPPVEMKVRWVQQKADTLNPKGETVSLDATVVLDRAVAVGSRMWLGKLNDWYGTGSAGYDDNVMEVVTYEETPDVKNRNTRRTAGLKFFRDSPH